MQSISSPIPIIRRLSLALLALLAARTPARADTTYSQVNATVHSTDPDGRRGFLAIALGTDYQASGFSVPVQVSAAFAPVRFLVVDGHARLGLNAEEGTRSLDAGGGATLCLLSPRVRGPINTLDSISGNFFVSRNVIVPEAARGCLGPSAGMQLHHYAVKVTNAPGAPNSEAFVNATAPVVSAGLRAISRVKADVTTPDGRFDQSSVRVYYLEALYGPDVSADVPMGAPAPDFKKWGGRFGFEQSRMKPSFGWNWGLEAGVHPGGALNHRVFLRFTIGVAFGL